MKMMVLLSGFEKGIAGEGMILQIFTSTRPLFLSGGVPQFLTLRFPLFEGRSDRFHGGNDS